MSMMGEEEASLLCSAFLSHPPSPQIQVWGWGSMESTVEQSLLLPSPPNTYLLILLSAKNTVGR